MMFAYIPNLYALLITYKLGTQANIIKLTLNFF